MTGVTPERRSWEDESSVGVSSVSVGVKAPPDTVPFHMPTVSTADPATRVASGMSVSTVNVHVPAGKPVAPPAGSTTQPFPSGSVGSVARAVVEDVPGANAYQPVSPCAGTFAVVESADAPALVSSAKLPVTAPSVAPRYRGDG